MMFAYVLPLKAENGAGGIPTPRRFQSRKLQRWPYQFLLCSGHFNPLFSLTNPQYPLYFWLSQCQTSPILYKSHQHMHSSHQPSLSQICRRFPTHSVPVSRPLSAIQRHERYFSPSILCPLSVPGCQCQPLFLKIKIVCCVLFLITKALHKTVCIDRLTKSLKPTKALFKLLRFQAKHTI